MKPFKAIIFDFDGVIVDSEHKKFEDLKELLKEYNIKLNSKIFPNFIGKKTGSFLKENFNLKEEDIQKIAKKRREIELKHSTELKLIQGIEKLLKYFKENNKIIAITTGSKSKLVNKILKEKELDQFVDLIIGGDEFNKSKPDPECYKITLEKLNLNSEEVIVIEDSIAGIKASKATNCFTIGLETNLKKEQLNEADITFKDHDNILTFLKKS